MIKRWSWCTKMARRGPTHRQCVNVLDSAVDECETDDYPEVSGCPVAVPVASLSEGQVEEHRAQTGGRHLQDQVIHAEQQTNKVFWDLVRR
jgi:hypothetical protein